MLNLVRVSVLAGRGRAWLIRRIITLVGPGRAEGYSAAGGRMRLGGTVSRADAVSDLRQDIR